MLFCLCVLYFSALLLPYPHTISLLLFFFFKQKTAYEMRISDWSSDVCSSDLCWVRSRNGARLDRRLLAVIADCAALALAGALGRPASGSSLDNAIRFLAEPVSEWTLARMRVEGIGNGIAHVSTRLFRSEEHTSELQSLMRISYAVFCLKKKKA